MAEKTNVPEIRFAGFADPWEQRKLGELCTISKGHSYSKADIRDAGTPLILYGRLYTQYESRIEDVDTFAVEQEGSLLSKGNEVIVPASGETAEDIAVASSVRRSGIIFGGDLNVVTPVSKLDPDYTALAITYSKAHDDLAKRAQGKSVVHVHGNDIAEVEISYPSESEQKRISTVVLGLDNLITLHQRKYDKLCTVKKSMLDKMFPKPGESEPEIRFEGFTDPWEQRKLGDEFERIQERNREGFGNDRWISVAKMYFQNPEKVQSNNLDTRTYVMRYGDIAFEGHKNSEHEYGRFVVNDIGDGIISELFPIYRHKCDYRNQFWKYAVMLETTWRPIFARSIAASGNSSNKVIDEHMYVEMVQVPCIEEQQAIGDLFSRLDSLITLHQRKLELLRNIKKSLLDRMFV